MRFAFVSFLFLVDDFDLSVSSVTRNRACARQCPETHIVPLAGVYANGTLVVLLSGVRRGPTRRSAIAIPISFEPKQERICLARPSISKRRVKAGAVVSAVLSGFPVSCANFQCAEDSARYSQRIRRIC